MRELRYLVVGLVVLMAGIALVGTPRSAVGEQPCLIIGMVHGGSITDGGYSQSMHDGLMEVKKNIPCVETLEAENVPDAQAEQVMETMIQQGAKLIFPASFGFQFPALNVARRHRDVVFMHPGGWMVEENFGNFFARVQETMFIMGVAAGRMTKTNKLGFIGGMPIGFVLGNANAFHLGARAVNPNVTTYYVSTGSWLDRAKEVAATQALLQQGVDVVAMHVDSPGAIIQTAEAAGAYSIGYQSLAAQQFAPNYWITGLGFTWGGMMTEMARQVIEGSWKPVSLRGGLAEGYLAIAPFGPAVPTPVRQFTLAVAEGLKAGVINPFCGPIKDQAGTVRIAEGECWGNERMGDFDWLVEGIIGQPK